MFREAAHDVRMVMSDLQRRYTEGQREVRTQSMTVIRGVRVQRDEARRMDYQIWCGPAQGAFNDWVRGSFLEPPEARDAVQIAFNLLEGAAVITRAQQLRTYGVPMPAAAFDFSPRPLA